MRARLQLLYFIRLSAIDRKIWLAFDAGENFVGRKFYEIEQDQTAIDGNRKFKRRAKSRNTDETGEAAEGLFDRGRFVSSAVYYCVSQGTRR